MAGDGNGFARVFRGEVAISDVDLRVEIAKNVNRTVSGNENIDLEEKVVHARGDLSMMRHSRKQVVKGDYHRVTDNSDILMVGSIGWSWSGGGVQRVDGTVTETVLGGVEIKAQQESEAILGGAYNGVFLGPFLRIAAWCDFLCWGGWVEIDVVRTEVSSATIRSMMFYSHTAAIRLTFAYNMVDDFIMRYEQIGVFDNRVSSTTHIGSPGSGVTMET